MYAKNLEIDFSLLSLFLFIYKLALLEITWRGINRSCAKSLMARPAFL